MQSDHDELLVPHVNAGQGHPRDLGIVLTTDVAIIIVSLNQDAGIAFVLDHNVCDDVDLKWGKRSGYCSYRSNQVACNGSNVSR